jgi:Flp pilus assembly protein TadG
MPHLNNVQRTRIRVHHSEQGQAALELAITLPLLLLLIFGIMVMAGWYFQQTAVAIATASAARAGGIARGNVAVAEQTNAALLKAFGAEEVLGSSAVTVDEPRRAVIVETTGQFEGRIPFLNLDLRLFAGSFARRWDFYPGPPKPWE